MSGVPSSPPVADGTAALSVSGLRVGLSSGPAVVDEVDIRLGRGEILGLVGESGSGKTTTALALLGYSGPGVEIWEGSLELDGTGVAMDESMRSSRGAVISYVSQNPGRALNPALRIIDAIEDLLRAHGAPGSREEVARKMLDTVGLESTQAFARRYPHQLSGGQQQRVCIAVALSCDPAVVVLDEPTTGLDVVTQARILEELVRLRDEQGIAMVYVTHDLAVVSNIADRIAVMYAGRIVEEGPAASLLATPRHPYTRGLLASIPDHVNPRRLDPMPGTAVGVGERPTGCSFAPRCGQRTDACTAAMPALEEIGDGRAVRCLHWEKTPPSESVPLIRSSRSRAGEAPLLAVENLRAEHRTREGRVLAAADISFEIMPGACVALVGESGSGKTTIARAIAGLHEISGGTITLAGESLSSLSYRRTVDQRRAVQLVFQNPADALNPRHTVGDAIARPARILRGLGRSASIEEARRLLERVRLPARIAARFPSELSGGERQRVGIARALAAEPDLILCDEVTSALDVSVQAAVLALLDELRDELGVGLLFITHDLGVVATVADEVMVLEKGAICERGRTEQVLRHPQHPYTQRLLAAAPTVAGVGSDSGRAG
ncbi:MAG: ABC transporter ATP-binding protein [Actinobacteria bacterium]|nr:ABC transporter ATP-binding protein [Actinomycetota bacterium]